ncbi:leucine-rich repeat protein [Segatella sp.]|uniref:leucine-rich repeat protein n=1 Tax=Segatella sp. TaxID=2974253 RepID=UPI00305E5387
MRKIIQYMMMALIAVVLASCANDISEESTPTVKSNIRFVVDDFPMFEKPSTRTIGEEDKGKTAWAVGDEICVKLESKELGIQTATLKYNGVKFEIQDGNSLCYLDGEPVTAYAYYAPGRKWLNDGYLGYKDGERDGTAEFLEATCTVHYGDDNYIDISFANVTRNYSRLRIATMPNKPITVTINKYTPAGSSNMAWSQYYALTSDEKGNAYLYGTFVKNSQFTVKYGGAPLATYKFTQETENAKSYALDATVISANSAEEIKSAIEQKIADGKTAIRLNLASDAGDNEFKAIRDAFKNVKSGTIDLTLIGCKEIPANGLKDLMGLKSISLPDVTKIGMNALLNCVNLQEICAPNVSAIDEYAFGRCYNLGKVTFGKLTDVRGEANSGAGIFDDINGLKPYIYLYLPKNQEVMKGEFDYNSNQYIWKPTGESYFASYDYDNRIFLGYQFLRVMS